MTPSLEQRGDQDEDNTLSDVLSLSSVVEVELSPVTSYHSKQPLSQPPALSLDARLVEMKPTIGLSKTPYHVRYPIQARTDFSPGEAKPEAFGKTVKQDNISGNLYRSDSINLSLIASEGEVPTIVLAAGGQTGETKKKGRPKAVISPGEIPFPQQEMRDGIDVINISRSSALSVGTQGGEEKRDGEDLAVNSLGVSNSPRETQGTPDETSASLPPGVTAVKPLPSAPSGDDDTEQELTGEGDKGSRGSDASDAANVEVDAPPTLPADPKHRAKSSSPAFSLRGPKEDDRRREGTWADEAAAAQSSSSSTCALEACHASSLPPSRLPALSTLAPPRPPPPPINVPTASVDVEASSSSAVSAVEGPAEFEQSPTPSYSSDFDFSSVSLVSFR